MFVSALKYVDCSIIPTREDLEERHGLGEHPPRRLVVDAAVALQNHGHEVLR
jgi:hypothetical protein